jgi:hypothetical protein
VNAASVALAARVVLAVVLAVAALAKMRGRAELTAQLARQQMGRLVGQAFAPVIEPVLPVAEIGVAVALVAWWSPVPGVVALAQARHVPCVCFGTSSLVAPVGPWAIMRNGLLAALAVLSIGDPSGAKVLATAGLCVLFGALAGAAVRAAR